MHIVIAFLFTLFIIQPVLAQPPSKTQKPVKNEMQAQINEAVNELKKQITDLEKQITDAKKNKEDPESIQQMEEELSMLKKQVAMMGGVTKGLANVSDKIIQQATEADNNDSNVPKRDDARIKSIPDRILSNTELISYIKNTQVEVEKKISPVQLEQAKYIYNNAKEKKQADNIGTLASLCWMNNYPELALYFAGKACIDNMENPDNLNNYAAFLTMTGGEHIALPILQNLNKNFPDNSTILNNIGQAWFGLGDMNNSKKHQYNI